MSGKRSSSRIRARPATVPASAAVVSATAADDASDVEAAAIAAVPNAPHPSCHATIVNIPAMSMAPPTVPPMTAPYHSVDVKPVALDGGVTTTAVLLLELVELLAVLDEIVLLLPPPLLLIPLLDLEAAVELLLLLPLVLDLAPVELLLLLDF